MKENQMTRRLLLLLALVGSLTVGMTGLALARGGPLPPDLQAVRAAVARYHSYDQALADGYDIGAEPCVAAPGLGTMGYHAVNLGLLGSGAIDPLRPPILLYAPRADGSLRLVGVEYFAVALVNTPDGPRPWFGQQDPRTQDPPLTFFNPAPSLFGQTFDGPMAGHNPDMPWHYDLHVWVVDENPAGTFAQFNPALSC
jgi:hypothetical protein